MVLTMDRDPASRAFLEAADAEVRERHLEPLGAAEGAVCEQAVEPDVHAERAEDVKTQEARDEPRPGEQGGNEREEREEVHREDACRV
jgi:hypothetical protein